MPQSSYRLKLDRARRHISELKTEVQALLGREPFEIYVVEDAATGRQHYKVRIKEAIPSEWSTIIGDVIHNARAALDLLMVEIVRHCDPGRSNYDHVYFVIRDSKAKFEADLPKSTKGATTAAQVVIEGLKPYKGGEEGFYHLHKLDILDKHKAIIPAGAAHRNIVMDMAKGIRENFPEKFGSLPPALLALRPADRQFPLQDGSILFTTGIGAPLDHDMKFTVELAFGEGQVLDGEPLDPALEHICELVERTFDTCEAQILSK